MFLKSCPWPRVCNNCGEAKPIEDFAFRNKVTGERKGFCRACRPKNKNALEHSRKYRANNRGLCNTRSYKWALENKRILNYSKIFTKICYNCLHEFITIHHDEKYCSGTCRKAVRSKYDASKYQKHRREDVEKVRARERINKRNKILKLSDSYIKDKLTEKTALDFKDIPQALIDLKRVQLRALRSIKNVEGRNDHRDDVKRNPF